MSDTFAYSTDHNNPFLRFAYPRVKNDILLNMNKQHVTLLVLLDLSAAFDTVDYDILEQRLRVSYGISGNALTWFSSYIHDRIQRISVYHLCKPHISI
jgi:hypothetical protein